MKNEFKLLSQKLLMDFDKPHADSLEFFENRHQKSNYLIPIYCNEFTCICPVTGQPDFAEIKIKYVPAKRCVESKSLKFYLASYRNYGIFHESVVNQIFEDLWRLLEPKYLYVKGNFKARGGISIRPLKHGFAEFLTKKEKEEIMLFCNI